MTELTKGEKIRQTMIKNIMQKNPGMTAEEADKARIEHYKAIAREGGKKGTTGGFAADREKAISYGAKGGKYSRHGYRLIERHDTYGLYTKTATGETVKIEYK